MKHSVCEGLQGVITEERRAPAIVGSAGLFELDIANGRGSGVVAAVIRQHAWERTMFLTKLI